MARSKERFLSGWVVTYGDEAFLGTFSDDYSTVRERAAAVSVVNELPADDVMITPAKLTLDMAGSRPLENTADALRRSAFRAKVKL